MATYWSTWQAAEAAQAAEIAALREELAAQKETVALFESEYSKQSASLTAAEQRNAELVELLRDVHGDCKGERCYTHQEFWVEQAIKPTESGANE